MADRIQEPISGEEMVSVPSKLSVTFSPAQEFAGLTLRVEAWKKRASDTPWGNLAFSAFDWRKQRRLDWITRLILGLRFGADLQKSAAD